MTLRGLTVALLACGVATPALAASNSISGTVNGLNWKAESRIIGQTSTATAAGGGNPIYFANNPKYSGVVSLIMDEGAAGRFICSGTLLADRVSVLTAGHCVSGGAGTANPIKTTAYFYGGPDPDIVNHNDPRAIGIDASAYFVNPNYTGEVIDQNDIAIVRLSQAAPDYAKSYAVFDGGDIAGAEYNIVGFGGRSDTGGAVGVNLGTGRKRQGLNTYDYRWGDDAFGGFFTDRGANGENFFGTAEVAYSYVSDFDNGNAANDTACQIAAAVGAPGGFGCGTGIGAREVSSAGGDSGGPQFVNGRIASVTSYGLTFGSDYGDIDDALNDSWGEFNGFVPTSIHYNWIAHVAAVPEPATWAMMLMGFGFVGAGMRSRKRSVVFA
jgi:hypothetical protein